MCVCLRWHTASWGYGGICPAATMKPSTLRGWGTSERLILNEVICNLEDPTVEIQKRKDCWKICWLKVKLDLFFFLPLTHLQVFVGCDPVPPHSQHTDDVMFVWEELCLLWRLLLQTHYTQMVKFTDVSRHGWNLKEPGLIWGIIQTSEDMLTDSSICLQPHTCSKCK